MTDFADQMAELAEQGVTTFIVEDEDTERRLLNELWAEECRMKEQERPPWALQCMSLAEWYRHGVLCVHGINVRPMKGSVYDVGEMD